MRIRRKSLNKIDDKIPNMWLLEENLLILCGVVDWIEVLADGSLHIIDFKTGKGEEESTLQLPIYCLLVKKYFGKRKISRTSLWYLQRQGQPSEVGLPEMDGVIQELIEKGKEIKSYRTQKEILCPEGGCGYCYEYELVLQGKAKYIGVDKFIERDVYLVEK